MGQMDILTAALFCPGPNEFAGLPLLLISPPGAAKTSIVRTIVRIA